MADLPAARACLGDPDLASFSTDPTNFTIDLSASIDFTLAGIELAGSVTDAVIDVGKLEAGQFPVTSIGGASFSANGTFAGATIKAEGFLATYTDPNGKSVLYGGIDGGLDFAGLAGFEIRLGISQLGPLDVYAEVDAPIILDPDTGLAITDLSAGINFGSGLTTPTSAADLGTGRGRRFFARHSPSGNQLWPATFRIRSRAIPPGQLRHADDDPGQCDPVRRLCVDRCIQDQGQYRIRHDRQVARSAVTATLGGSITVNASAFIDLSQVASGKAKLLIDVTALAEVRSSTPTERSTSSLTDRF